MRQCTSLRISAPRHTLAAEKKAQLVRVLRSQLVRAAQGRVPRSLQCATLPTRTMAGVLAEAFTEGRCALAGIKQSLRCVRKPCGGVAKAAFEGSVDDFVAANPGAEAQCYNRVKQCGHCRKVCAYTLATCNGCGADLASVDESRTPNVFMGFAHGIARAGFPLRASTRLETEDVLVFDDPLVLAGCHVCAIPTDVHVPTCVEIKFYGAFC